MNTGHQPNFYPRDMGQFDLDEDDRADDVAFQEGAVQDPEEHQFGFQNENSDYEFHQQEANLEGEVAEYPLHQMEYEEDSSPDPSMQSPEKQQILGMKEEGYSPEQREELDPAHLLNVHELKEFEKFRKNFSNFKVKSGSMSMQHPRDQISHSSQQLQLPPELFGGQNVEESPQIVDSSASDYQQANDAEEGTNPAYMARRGLTFSSGQDNGIAPRTPNTVASWQVRVSSNEHRMQQWEEGSDFRPAMNNIVQYQRESCSSQEGGNMVEGHLDYEKMNFLQNANPRRGSSYDEGALLQQFQNEEEEPQVEFEGDQNSIGEEYDPEAQSNMSGSNGIEVEEGGHRVDSEGNDRPCKCKAEAQPDQHYQLEDEPEQVDGNFSIENLADDYAQQQESLRQLHRSMPAQEAEQFLNLIAQQSKVRQSQQEHPQEKLQPVSSSAGQLMTTHDDQTLNLPTQQILEALHQNGNFSHTQNFSNNPSSVANQRAKEQEDASSRKEEEQTAQIDIQVELINRHHHHHTEAENSEEQDLVGKEEGISSSYYSQRDRVPELEWTEQNSQEKKGKSHYHSCGMKQQNMYQQLSPQIITSKRNSKPKKEDQEFFRNQGFEMTQKTSGLPSQHQAFIADPNESLSKPAIISQSSNQKITTNSRQNYAGSYSPSNHSRSNFGRDIGKQPNHVSTIERAEQFNPQQVDDAHQPELFGIGLASENQPSPTRESVAQNMGTNTLLALSQTINSSAQQNMQDRSIPETQVAKNLASQMPPFINSQNTRSIDLESGLNLTDENLTSVREQQQQAEGSFAEKRRVQSTVQSTVQDQLLAQLQHQIQNQSSTQQTVSVQFSHFLKEGALPCSQNCSSSQQPEAIENKDLLLVDEQTQIEAAEAELEAEVLKLDRIYKEKKESVNQNRKTSNVPEPPHGIMPLPTDSLMKEEEPPSSREAAKVATFGQRQLQFQDVSRSDSEEQFLSNFEEFNNTSNHLQSNDHNDNFLQTTGKAQDRHRQAAPATGSPEKRLAAGHTEPVLEESSQQLWTDQPPEAYGQQIQKQQQRKKGGKNQNLVMIPSNENSSFLEEADQVDELPSSTFNQPPDLHGNSEDLHFSEDGPSSIKELDNLARPMSQDYRMPHFFPAEQTGGFQNPIQVPVDALNGSHEGHLRLIQTAQPLSEPLQRDESKMNSGQFQILGGNQSSGLIFNDNDASREPAFLPYQANQAILLSLQEQNAQLRHYKQLCEQRICELAPGHPLPLSIEHLGQEWASPEMNSLQQINRTMISQVSKLQSQLNQERLQTQFDQAAKEAHIERLSIEVTDLKAQLEQTGTSQKAPSVTLGNDSQVRSPSPSKGIEFSQHLSSQFLNLKTEIDKLKKEKVILEKQLKTEQICSKDLRFQARVMKKALESKVQDQFPQFKEFVNWQKAHNPEHKNLIQAIDIFMNTEKDGKPKNGRWHGPGSPVSSRVGQKKPPQTVIDHYIKVYMLQQDNLEKKKEVADLQKHLKESQEDTTSLKQQLAEAQQEMGQMQHRLEQGDPTELKMKILQMEEDLGQQSKNLAMYQQFMGSLQQYKNNLKKENQELENKLSEANVNKQVQAMGTRCKELEAVIKKLEQTIKHLQQTNMEQFKQVQALEQTQEKHVSTIETMKMQNIWLKEERQKLSSANQLLKEATSKNSNQMKDLEHQAKISKSLQQESEEAHSFKANKMQAEICGLNEKLQLTSAALEKAEKAKETVEAEVKVLEQKLEEASKLISKAKRDKGVAETKLRDIEQENEALFKNEERIKVLISEKEGLRTQNNILSKEMDYLEQKNKQVLYDISKIESELRCLAREKQELADQVGSFSEQKNELKSQIMASAQEVTSLRQALEEKEVKLRQTEHEVKKQSGRTEEVRAKLDKTEQYQEDLQTMLSKSIQKQNDFCMQLEQEAKLVEGVKLIQSNAHSSLIIPFLKDLKQQVEVSDILKECFSNGIFQAFPDFYKAERLHEKENEAQNLPNAMGSPQTRDFNNTMAHAPSGYHSLPSEPPKANSMANTTMYQHLHPILPDQQRYFSTAVETNNPLRYVICQMEQFISMDLTSSKQIDLLYSQKQLLMKYVQFLQQGVVEKLVSSLVQNKSNQLLQSKNCQGLTKEIMNLRDRETNSQQTIEKMNFEIRTLQSQLGQMRIGSSYYEHADHSMYQTGKQGYKSTGPAMSEGHVSSHAGQGVYMSTLGPGELRQHNHQM